MLITVPQAASPLRPSPDNCQLDICHTREALETQRATELWPSHITNELVRGTESEPQGGRQSRGWSGNSPQERRRWEDCEGNSVGGRGNSPCEGAEQEPQLPPCPGRAPAGSWEDGVGPFAQLSQSGWGLGLVLC